MNDERVARFILITGDLATGKTTLLLQLEKRLRKRYRLAGVANVASSRAYRSATPAGGYDFKIIPSGESYSWLHAGKTALISTGKVWQRHCPD